MYCESEINKPLLTLVFIAAVGWITSFFGMMYTHNKLQKIKAEAVQLGYGKYVPENNEPVFKWVEPVKDSTEKSK